VVLGLDTGLVLATAVVALRMAVILALMPLMDRRSVPLLWRLAVALPLAWAVAPAVAGHLELPTTIGWPLLAMEALNSLVVGALLTFAMNLVLTAVRYAGGIAGMQIGFAIVNAYDPQTDSQISIVAQLYYLLTVLLFFTLDVHHLIIQALVASLEAVPPFVVPDFSAASGVLLREYSQVFLLGLRLSAPVVVVLMLISAAMGVIVKTAPQIHVLVVGFPVKIAVGMMVLGGSLTYFHAVVARAFTTTGDLLARILAAMA
jgi:flagellar biosynthetic protein FliR